MDAGFLEGLEPFGAEVGRTALDGELGIDAHGLTVRLGQFDHVVVVEQVVAVLLPQGTRNEPFEISKRLVLSDAEKEVHG